MPQNKPTEILITEPFPDELLKSLREVSPHINITIQAVRYTDDISDDVWEKVEILYTRYVLPTAEQAPNLRWIQFHYAGVDHALDNPILKKPDLIATSLSGAAAPQVAEHVLTMMLVLGHHLPEILDLQHQKTWSHKKWLKDPPQELGFSTVGILGYGSIGRRIAQLLRPFGATVLATKRDAMHPEYMGYIDEDFGDFTGELAHRLYPPQATRTMLKECDYVLVTIPLTPETSNMIGKQEFEAMKPNALLVDVSRGGVINLNALIKALTEKKIAGAALDVFPEEPLPEDHPLWRMPNVIITPHIAGYSAVYNERAVKLFSKNLELYLTNRPLYNVIDVQKGY